MSTSTLSNTRFTSRAAKIGPETEAVIALVLDGKPVVEQAFVPCRNILVLASDVIRHLESGHNRQTESAVNRQCAGIWFGV